MYKQVTPDQLDIWLSDPVTKSYLDCLSYCLEQMRKQIADGIAVDPTNSSVTQYNSGYSAGRRDTFNEALNPASIFALYERPEVANA